MFRAGEMTRRGYVAGVCAGGVMVLIALAMDLAGVVLPGRQYTVGLLGGLVVVMTGQLVSWSQQPPSGQRADAQCAVQQPWDPDRIAPAAVVPPFVEVRAMAPGP